MKRLIILLTALSFYGCSAFDVVHLERLVCVGMNTPWANDTERTDEAIYWYINKDGWHSRSLSADTICIKEIMSAEQLAIINGKK